MAATLSFKDVSANYTSDKVEGTCKSHINQCAIRMSGALRRAGFDFKTYSDPVCKDDDGEKYARGAESVANFLYKNLKAPKRYSSLSEALKQIKAKKGIIFFKDIPGFRNNIGDHIDIWYGETTSDGHLYDSKEIWFWELN
jgi:hypothetical protein